jgi:aminoglycoside phosphotransferase (APT) family kinase protein
VIEDNQQLQAFQALIAQFAPGSRLTSVRPMTGGISSQTTALAFTRPDGTDDRAIVRQHGAVDRAHNPDIARDEFRLLDIVRTHGVAAPAPIHVDASCTHFPVPVIVIEFVEGEPGLPVGDHEIEPSIEQAAAQLALIHRIADSPDLAFLPRRGRGYGDPPATLDLSMQEGLIRDALAAAQLPEPGNPPTLLHGDFWPGNLLWKDGILTAVIDWEDAAVGDPLADLGNIRLELLWAAGPEAMEQFTDRYQLHSGLALAKLPYWDLVAALRPCGQLGDFGLDAETEQRWRELHRTFVDEALGGKAARRAGIG